MELDEKYNPLNVTSFDTSDHYFSLKELMQHGKLNAQSKGPGRSKGQEDIYSLPSTKFKKGAPAFVKCEIYSWVKELANLPQNYSCEMPKKCEEKELENSIKTITKIINTASSSNLERDMLKKDREEKLKSQKEKYDCRMCYCLQSFCQN